MHKISKMKGWQLYDYYQWMLDKIDAYIEPYYNYSLLLSDLHSIVFTYGMTMDGNRAADGKKLRKEYIDSYMIPDIFYIESEEIPCSVLEMMIALSLRCSREILVGEDYRPSKWFWTMIENLDLMRCSDDHYDTGYVYQQVGIWLDRSFKRNGSGSPFPLSKTVGRDQRKVDIWFQMCGYISENYL